ncbi:MAG: magnesium transporter CorA family protein [Candidatus Levybacteria bacterium]|nr:magnesium transporter CorA family protein [Candidatus Levybacteria bacterium]
MNIKTVTHGSMTFAVVQSPQELEIKELKKNYNFSSIHLEDYLSRKQFPKIETAGEYTLIALDFPHVESPEDGKSDEKVKKESSDLEKDNVPKKEFTTTIKDIIITPVVLPTKLLFSESHKKRINTSHVNFFIGKDYLVVLHDEKTPQIDEIFNLIQKTLQNREQLMGSGPYYLFYRIVNHLVDSTYLVMREISTMIDDIDIHLLKNNPPLSVVEDISVTRRNIVFLKSMIEPSLHIFSDLANGKHEEFNKTDRVYWNSISNHLQKTKYRLHSSQELIEGITLSHESLLTAKTNEIVKVLTMFTAILLPLTLIASIYGMNIVGLPLAEEPGALGTLILAMILIGLMMILGFRIKRWF